MRTDFYTVDKLRLIAQYPHLIGKMVGKSKLSHMHSRWIHSLWDPAEHTSLMAHRGSYKTTALTEVGVVFHLLFHPDDRICLIRETWTEANNTLETISNYMQSELVQELFRALHDNYPIATTDRDGRLAFSFKRSITKEGSVDAYGVDTVPTGSHYDVVLVDDAITIRDRFSRAKRERTCENLMEIKANILDPGKFMRCVGTPWHKEDAWRLLPRPMRYDVYSTGILSPEQIEEKKRDMTHPMFAANYELEHMAGEDMLFSEPEYGAWVKSNQKMYAHLDAAYGGRDTTALTIMQRKPNGGIQAWGKRYLGAAEKHIEDIRLQTTVRGCRWITMEDNGDKGFLAKLVGATNLSANTYHESQNKHIKIVSYLGHHWHDVTWDPQTDPEYLAQVTDYAEDAQPDDCPDSAASLLKYVFFPQEGHSAAWRAMYKA